MTRLTAEDGDHIQACLDRLTDAASHLQGAAASLGRVKGFEREAEKLTNSTKAIEHERRMVQDRMDEITARARRRGE